MSEIEELLLTNENSKFETHPHWIVFAMPVIFSFVTISTLFIPIPFHMITGMMGIFTGFTWIISLISRRFTVYAITNKRVIKKSGLLSRKTSGVLLERIESVDVIQTITGRIIGSGTVVIRGTGGGIDNFVNISDPFEFRRRLMDQVAELS